MEVPLVHILHVLHLTVLHVLRDDDNFRYTQSQRCRHRCCSVLYDVEPLQWLHDFSHGNNLCTHNYIRLRIQGPHFVNCLRAHFLDLVQRIPIWWRWYYWANPIAWSLYGLLTAQYGDMNELVKLTDGVQTMPIKQLLKDQFGFRHDFLGIAGLVVVGFCVLFAGTFAFAIKSFNFQRR